MRCSHRWLIGTWFLAMLAGQSGMAGAQDAAKAPDVDESKLPDWIKRQASSPQKVIINSTAVRAKAEPAKPEVAPARNAHPAPPRKPPLATAPSASGPSVQPDATAVAPSPPTPSRTTKLSELPPPANATPAPVAPPEPAPAAAAAPELVLLNRVDPVLAADLVDVQFGNASVTVAFTIGAQGEIINPQVTASTDRRLNRSVLQAVAEWRYAPVSEPRPHAVTFTFEAAP
jgi:TonB family protein